LLRRRADAYRPRTVFTVHNAAFQGNFDLHWAQPLGVPPELLTADGIEFYGRMSYLKAGVRYADAVTTVSPRYAREIRTPEFGCGLDGVFESRAADLTGILNGIDTVLWNPATDPHLAARFSVDDRAGKRLCKAALQRELGLTEAPQRPLVIAAARLTEQKMADVVLERLPVLLARHPDLQFALLGQGDRAIEQGFIALAARFPERVAVRIGYAEPIAHRIQAGGDILLHGSRFEPCGLTQMYAMHYGTVPIVRRVGGLADTVIDADDPRGGGATGFAFDEATGAAMEAAVERCVHAYRTSPQRWQQLQANGMRLDVGWERSARAYLRVYRASGLGVAPSAARVGSGAMAKNEDYLPAAAS
jgi:starch synthase